MMYLARIGIHLLELLFFTGVLGSSIVVVISFVEDLHDLFGSE